MKTNPVRHKLKRGEASFGTWLTPLDYRKPRWAVDEKVYNAPDLRAKLQ